jgi:hypothetical protein
MYPADAREILRRRRTSGRTCSCLGRERVALAQDAEEGPRGLQSPSQRIVRRLRVDGAMPVGDCTRSQATSRRGGANA